MVTKAPGQRFPEWVRPTVGFQHVARRALAVLLLAMALGQLSDVGGFVDILMAYEVGDRTAAWGIAVALMTGELLGGVGLLRRGQRRRASLVAVLVAVGWTVLAAQAFLRGLAISNCGCFGVHLGQPLRWWVLLEDAEFVGLALWVARGVRRSQPNTPAAPTAAAARQLV